MSAESTWPPEYVLRDLAGVRWLPISGFPDYQVSAAGAVRRSQDAHGYPAGRPLKPKCNRFGYLSVCLYHEGHRHDVFLHRLVTLAFLGPQPTPSHEVAHGDGNKTNNDWRNLRWATKSQNCQQKREHGALPDIKGEKHPHARLTNSVVLAMRERRREGAYFREIAGEFGIPKLTAYDAIKGITWGHI